MAEGGGEKMIKESKIQENTWLGLNNWVNCDDGNQEGKIVRFEGEHLLYFEHFKAEIPVRYLFGDVKYVNEYTSVWMNIEEGWR